MPDSELKDTQPSNAVHDTQPNVIIQATQPGSTEGVPQKKFPSWLVVLIVLTLVVMGVLGGYSSGMGQRFAAQDTVVSGQLDEQFQLGQQAVLAGNYELALQYFKGIIVADSNFPGIQTAYTDLLLRMQVTPTPLFSPTPLVSPTPDLRGEQEIYQTALQLLNTNDWDGALTNLDSLRKLNPTYRTAEVDGMYYMALRQRGVEKISSGNCRYVNLEGGIYNLTLAEQFVGTGNLDAYAESLRTYARLYIIGSSFWDQDWIQAQTFFAQVMTGYPNMSDSSCETATSRWVQATLKVAEQLQAAGDNCGAVDQYASAFSVNDPLNATAYPTATEVENKCHPPNNGGDGGGGGTQTPTPTPEGTLTETPTQESSPTCDATSGTPCP